MKFMCARAGVCDLHCRSSRRFVRHAGGVCAVRSLTVRYVAVLCYSKWRTLLLICVMLVVFPLTTHLACCLCGVAAQLRRASVHDQRRRRLECRRIPLLFVTQSYVSFVSYAQVEHAHDESAAHGGSVSAACRLCRRVTDGWMKGRATTCLAVWRLCSCRYENLDTHTQILATHILPRHHMHASRYCAVCSLRAVLTVFGCKGSSHHGRAIHRPACHRPRCNAAAASPSLQRTAGLLSALVLCFVVQAAFRHGASRHTAVAAKADRQCDDNDVLLLQPAVQAEPAHARPVGARSARGTCYPVLERTIVAYLY